MASSPATDRQAGSLFRLEGEAHGVIDRLPELVLEAVRISNTVTHGLHGRRRAGPGETFWQFRQYESGDAAQLVDWRRSASSDHLYIREREWEAAHTVWLWSDLSPSMGFQSHLATAPKRDRALVLMFAAAELLVRAGERVALLGLTLPSASRQATRRMAEHLAANIQVAALTASLPPKARLSRFSGAVFVSDFLDPVDQIGARLDELAAAGVAGHLIQVLDPAEETLPYDGRTEFLGLEGGDRWISDRAESMRPEYQRRLAAHREALLQLTRRLGWSFLTHRTDRPATEPLLALMQRLQGGAGQGYRWSAPSAGGAAG